VPSRNGQHPNRTIPFGGYGVDQSGKSVTATPDAFGGRDTRGVPEESLSEGRRAARITKTIDEVNKGGIAGVASGPSPRMRGERVLAECTCERMRAAYVVTELSPLFACARVAGSAQGYLEHGNRDVWSVRAQA
jgi:hypothetical protein